jgi:hypothetical protein
MLAGIRQISHTMSLRDHQKNCNVQWDTQLDLDSGRFREDAVEEWKSESTVAPRVHAAQHAKVCSKLINVPRDERGKPGNPFLMTKLWYITPAFVTSTEWWGNWRSAGTGPFRRKLGSLALGQRWQPWTAWNWFAGMDDYHKNSTTYMYCTLHHAHDIYHLRLAIWMDRQMSSHLQFKHYLLPNIYLCHWWWANSLCWSGWEKCLLFS